MNFSNENHTAIPAEHVLTKVESGESKCNKVFEE